MHCAVVVAGRGEGEGAVAVVADGAVIGAQVRDAELACIVGVDIDGVGEKLSGRQRLTGVLSAALQHHLGSAVRSVVAAMNSNDDIVRSTVLGVDGDGVCKGLAFAELIDGRAP